MKFIPKYSPLKFAKDAQASLVVFLVALPLCLGIAVASGADPISGLISGIVGGIVVGSLSGSHISVSGPAAGLAAVVLGLLATIGSFEAFLAAVVIAGFLQILLGVFKGGFISSFFPSSVIKGLLAAIGVILILKQIPHLVGHDVDPEGEMAFVQADGENTFSELLNILPNFQPGSLIVGLVCLLVFTLWGKTPAKKLPIPSALAVVVIGVLGTWLLRGTSLAINTSHLVQVPLPEIPGDFSYLFTHPDFSAFTRMDVLVGGITIAIIASLETLLNIEAADNLDPECRSTPVNRELIAQGAGNIAAGFLGGLPVTSVVVRSSVNASVGAKTKMSAILHGVLLILAVIAIPGLINLVPLSALAAILIVTGYKLASPKLFKQMCSEGRAQFLPFIITVAMIVVTDLLTGVIIGLVIALCFILHSNLRRPLKMYSETHVWGDLLRIELGNQVSFLNRASIERTLNELPAGQHVLLDATHTDYIDPDIIDLIDDYKNKTAEVHGVKISLRGFKEQYNFEEDIQYVDYTAKELQNEVEPMRVLKYLYEGNQRFLSGHRITRDFMRQIDQTSVGQHPLAVILSCIDSRSPAEHVFDLGIGDIFSVRIAGNVARDKVYGSMEYSCVVAGARILVVLGHTSCGAVTAAVDLLGNETPCCVATGCDHIDNLLGYIQESIDPTQRQEALATGDGDIKSNYVNSVAKQNVIHTIDRIRLDSKSLNHLEETGRIAIVGGMYDIKTGKVEFFSVKDGIAETIHFDN